MCERPALTFWSPVYVRWSRCSTLCILSFCEDARLQTPHRCFSAPVDAQKDLSGHSIGLAVGHNQLFRWSAQGYRAFLEKNLDIQMDLVRGPSCKETRLFCLKAFPTTIRRQVGIFVHSAQAGQFVPQIIHF
jgi:hypothetical protein